QKNGAAPKNIPAGVTIYALTKLSSGRVLAAASNGYVYYTDDCGTSWTGVKLGTSTSVTCFAVTTDQSAIYAGTGDFGDVFKSTDSGTNWVNTSDLTGATSVYALTIGSSDRVYAGTNSTGTANIFYSSDGGTSWTPSFVINPTFLYRKPVTITNGIASALTDYPVRVTVTYVSGKMNADFSDIRFYTGSGAELPYWVESYTASVSAVVWVSVNSIPASGSTIIYMYYCNPAAISASDGDSTFSLFDHFDDDTVDTDIWTTQTGTLVESGTVITIGAGMIGCGDTFGTNYALRYRGLHRNFNTNIVGFINGTAGQCSVAERSGTFRVRSRVGANITTNFPGGLISSFQIYEIQRNNGTANRYLANDAQVANHTTQVTVSSLPITAYNSRNNAARLLELDWILVRKFRNPEPTPSFGAEQALLTASTTAIASMSEAIYAGTSLGNVYKSTDMGALWKITGTLSGANYIYKLFRFDASNLFATTGPSGDVFRTVTAGVSWTNTADLPAITQARVLAKALDGALLSGGSPNGDLFRSTDKGTTWELYPNIPGVVTVYCACQAVTNITYIWTGNSYQVTENPDDKFRRISEEGTNYIEDGYMKTLTFTYLKSDMTAADTSTQIGRDQINIVKVEFSLEDNGETSSSKNTIFLRKRGAE
ncbi:MAG: DUF2341 domain-containing protein, partial [Planctomycetota bacterium]